LRPDKSSQGAIKNPIKEAPPTLSVDGFFSTIPAMILDEGTQSASNPPPITAIVHGGMDREDKSRNSTAVAKTTLQPLRTP
jgi:hypothetical protein